MIFSSLVFLCIFFPLVLLLHSILPSLRLKNGLLIIASLFFYAYGEPVYVLLMLASSVLNYAAARLVAPGRSHRKAFLAAGVAANLGLLVFFKYAAFLVETCNALCSLHLPVPDIPLPVGISFFTFQALSYVIDVYQEKADVQKSYPRVLLYISFFPQLVKVREHTISMASSSAGILWIFFIEATPFQHSVSDRKEHYTRGG